MPFFSYSHIFILFMGCIADIAWRQAYLAKAKRWWSVRNSRVAPQGGCHLPIQFAVVEGAPALLDRLLLSEKPDTVAEALSCLSAQNLVQANSLEVALVRSLAPIRPPQAWHELITQHATTARATHTESVAGQRSARR